MYQLKVIKKNNVDQETFEIAFNAALRRIENEIEGLQLRAIVKGDTVTIESIDPKELITANQEELMRKIEACFCYSGSLLSEGFGAVVWLSYWS
ncbi:MULTISPECIES: hypothetical protein [Aeromonas]|uniref:hypothetical protein n=1 Tax=Aeromonas TaxID=642 RepID=UPI001318E295|nr:MULTISPECIES: hypothetical protein [Aeromonas]QHC07758.1 hypothetical protein GRF56_10210 [Aeromonas veronii]BDA17677.1 hypothetical protein KAM345_015910 [Aeromonas caviae]